MASYFPPDMEQQAINYFIDILVAKKVPQHFGKLFNDLSQNTNDGLKEFSKNCTEAERHKFFKDNSSFFQIKNGYVSLSSVWNIKKLINCDGSPSSQSKDRDKVIEFIICHLKNCGETHYTSLIQCMKDKHSDLQSFNPSAENNRIFTENSEQFICDADGFLNIPDADLQMEKSLEDKTAEFIIVLLQNLGDIHFEKLKTHISNFVPTLSDLISDLRASELFKFFKLMEKRFLVKTDGYVTLHPKIYVPCGRNSVEERLMESASMYLQRTGPIHVDKLVSCLRCLSSEFDSYFSSHDVFTFFHEHYHFDVWEDSCVSLSLIPVEDAEDSRNCVASSVSPNSRESLPKSIEEQVFEVVTWLLESAETGRMHYHKIIKSSADIAPDIHEYFSHLTPSEQYNFFKTHANNFIISTDGFVALTVDKLQTKKRRSSSTHDEKSSDGDFVELEIVRYFTSKLEKIGTLHYNDLADILKSSNMAFKDYFEDIKNTDVYWFLKVRNEIFCISDSGMVSLMSTVKLKTLSNSNVKSIEDRVVSYLILNLQQSKRNHCENLVKCLKGSDHELKDFFSDSSTDDVKTFFSRHSAEFRLDSEGFVTLPVTVKPKKKIRDFEKEATDIFVSMLKRKGKSYYGELIKCIQESDKTFCEYFKKVPNTLKFFQERDANFYVDSSGYVSCSLSRDQKRKEVIEYFKSCLSIVKAMGHQDLISHLILEDKEFSDYFGYIGISTDEYNFFKSCPEDLSIDSDGVVTIAKPPQTNIPTKNLSKAAILDVLKKHVSECKSIHYRKLCKVTPEVEKFFQNKQDSEQFWFFKNHSNHFSIGGDGNVKPPGTNISKPLPVRKATVQCEIDIIVAMREYLTREEWIHYEKLCNATSATKAFFAKYQLTEQFAYFKARTFYFVIDGDGYVQSAGPISQQQIDDCMQNTFVNILKLKKRVTYKAFRPIAMSFNANLKVYLEDIDHDIIKKFLVKRPRVFVFEDDNHVSLNTGVKTVQESKVSLPSSTGATQKVNKPTSAVNCKPNAQASATIVTTTSFANVASNSLNISSAMANSQPQLPSSGNRKVSKITPAIDNLITLSSAESLLATGANSQPSSSATQKISKIISAANSKTDTQTSGTSVSSNHAVSNSVGSLSAMNHSKPPTTASKKLKKQTSAGSLSNISGECLTSTASNSIDSSSAVDKSASEVIAGTKHISVSQCVIPNQILQKDSSKIINKTGGTTETTPGKEKCAKTSKLSTPKKEISTSAINHSIQASFHSNGIPDLISSSDDEDLPSYSLVREAKQIYASPKTTDVGNAQQDEKLSSNAVLNFFREVFKRTQGKFHMEKLVKIFQSNYFVNIKDISSFYTKNTTEEYVLTFFLWSNHFDVDMDGYVSLNEKGSRDKVGEIVREYFKTVISGESPIQCDKLFSYLKKIDKYKDKTVIKMMRKFSFSSKVRHLKKLGCFSVDRSNYVTIKTLHDDGNVCGDIHSKSETSSLESEAKLDAPTVKSATFVKSGATTSQLRISAMQNLNIVKPDSLPRFRSLSCEQVSRKELCPSSAAEANHQTSAIPAYYSADNQQEATKPKLTTNTNSTTAILDSSSQHLNSTASPSVATIKPDALPRLGSPSVYKQLFCNKECPSAVEADQEIQTTSTPLQHQSIIASENADTIKWYEQPSKKAKPPSTVEADQQNSQTTSNPMRKWSNSSNSSVNYHSVPASPTGMNPIEQLPLMNQHQKSFSNDEFIVDAHNGYTENYYKSLDTITQALIKLKNSNQQNISGNYLVNFYTHLLSRLSSISQFYNPNIEVKCVEYFLEILTLFGSQNVDTLMGKVELAPLEVKTYLNTYYGQQNFLLFFFLHLQNFAIDTNGRISTRVVESLAESLNAKAVRFFSLLLLNAPDGSMSLKKLQRSLANSSEDVQTYLSHYGNIKLFFAQNTEHFTVDEFGRISLKNVDIFLMK